MKRVLLACILASCTIAVSAQPAPTATPCAPANLTRIAKELFVQSQRGNVDPQLFAPSVRGLLKPAIARQVAADLSKDGPPTGFACTFVRKLVTMPGTGYVYRVSFAKAPDLSWYVAFSPGGQALGMFYYPYEPQMHLQQTQVIAALRAHLQREAAAGRFAGTVLLAKNGVPVFTGAYGMADRARHIPNTLDTRFRIGSMNKMFTAVSVLQLVQAGKLRLNEKLGEVLPDYPNASVRGVTIEQLLTHTGGTGDIFGPQFGAHRLQLRTLDDYVKLYGTRGVAFKPGSRFAYSNYGFVLLGVIVQRVSGESYYAYVREHVYAPAGMTSSGSQPEDRTVPKRSIGYTAAGGKIAPNTGTLPYRGTSAGGGYSTVGDLLRFANALMSDKLLDAAHTKMLITGREPMRTVPDIVRYYAFGFADQRLNGIRCYGHDGGAPGMSGSLLTCPQDGYTIAVLANVDPPAADLVTNFILNRLPL